MPIRVTCSCGQSLSVPDAMAGKSGKCPKCAGVIRIPAQSSAAAAPSANSAKSSSSAAKPASPTSAKPTKTSLSSAATGGGGLDQLFAEAGLDKKKGPECPACKAPIDPLASICVRCGFNLATGQKIKGVEFEVESADPAQFANRQLNDAKKSLKKEFEADEAAKYTGAPWWVSLAVVLGVITVIAFGVILVESFGKDDDGERILAASSTMKGKIQRLPIPNALLVVGSLVSSFVVIMAWIATLSAAFREKAAQGFLCLLIPLYAQFYSIKNRKFMSSTMKIFIGWSVVWIVLAVVMITSGTLKHLTK